MDSILLAQQKQDEYIKQLASKVDVLSSYNKILEAQISQQVASSSTPLGKLPCKPKPNSLEQCNYVILREGLERSESREVNKVVM